MPKTVFAVALAALALVSSAATAADICPTARPARRHLSGKAPMSAPTSATSGAASATAAANPSGVAGGVQAGYNWQIRPVRVRRRDRSASVRRRRHASPPWKFSNPWFGTLRARAGFATSNVLFYGTVGLAYGTLTMQEHADRRVGDRTPAPAGPAVLGVEVALTAQLDGQSGIPLRRSDEQFVRSRRHQSRHRVEPAALRRELSLLTSCVDDSKSPGFRPGLLLCVACKPHLAASRQDLERFCGDREVPGTIHTLTAFASPVGNINKGGGYASRTPYDRSVFLLSPPPPRRGRSAARPCRAKAPAYVPVGYNWTGFYLGINGGYGWGRSHWNGFGSSTDPSGGMVGVHRRLQLAGVGSPWVFGLEGDIDWTNIKGTLRQRRPARPVPDQEQLARNRARPPRLRLGPRDALRHRRRRVRRHQGQPARFRQRARHQCRLDRRRRRRSGAGRQLDRQARISPRRSRHVNCNAGCCSLPTRVGFHADEVRARPQLPVLIADANTKQSPGRTVRGFCFCWNLWTIFVQCSLTILMVKIQ